MRRLLSMIAFFAVCGCVLSQTAASPEQLIENVIESGGWEGHDAKVIGSMGDAAAVAVTKVLAGRTLGPGEIERALLILNCSFGDPGLVEIPADRAPRTTLFVLRRLDSATSDSGLKAKIAATQKGIEERCARAKGSAVSK
jgi:hypothetical protein